MGMLSLLLIQMFPQFLARRRDLPDPAPDGRDFPVIGLNTLAGLVIVYLGGALGVNAWLMKGFFDSIPNELDESARVDGATPAQVFWGVILPLGAPGARGRRAALVHRTMNEFIIASRLLQTTTSRRCRVGMYGFISDQYGAALGAVLRGRRARRDPGRAAVPLPAAVHRPRAHLGLRQGMSTRVAPLSEPHHDGSALYVPEQPAEIGDEVTVAAPRAARRAAVDVAAVRYVRDGEPRGGRGDGRRGDRDGRLVAREGAGLEPDRLVPLGRRGRRRRLCVGERRGSVPRTTSPTTSTSCSRSTRPGPTGTRTASSTRSSPTASRRRCAAVTATARVGDPARSGTSRPPAAGARRRSSSTAATCPGSSSTSTTSSVSARASSTSRRCSRPGAPIATTRARSVGSIRCSAATRRSSRSPRGPRPRAPHRRRPHAQPLRRLARVVPRRPGEPRGAGARALLLRRALPAATSPGWDPFAAEARLGLAGAPPPDDRGHAPWLEAPYELDGWRSTSRTWSGATASSQRRRRSPARSGGAWARSSSSPSTATTSAPTCRATAGRGA